MKVHLKAGNGQYVTAEGGGGQEINANRSTAQLWETFDLQVVGGGALVSGAKVNLKTSNGKSYLSANQGGGGTLKADREWAKEWETFEITAPDIGLGLPIPNGAGVTLQTQNGHFLCAENNGGHGVNATRIVASTWETFRIEQLEAAPQPIPFHAAQYVFSLVSMDIYETRSAHRDTDIVSCTLAINDTPPQTQSKPLGDVNNGTFPIGLSLGPLPVNSANDKVIFNHLVVNSGHKKWDEANKIISQGGQWLASEGTKRATSAAGALLGASIGTGVLPIVGSAIGAVVGWAVSALVGLLIADCDGVVAVQQVGLTGKQLCALVDANGGNYLHHSYHPGTNSSQGCGANSLYRTSWSIRRA